MLRHLPDIGYAETAKFDSIERYMRDGGLYSTAEIRPVNETKMRAYWKPGWHWRMLEPIGNIPPAEAEAR